VMGKSSYRTLACSANHYGFVSICGIDHVTSFHSVNADW
jgi:hypothetical protein